MKYDLNNKTNRFAKRTLADLSNVMFLLLSKKPFEEITVNKLCEISNYPRATFYNYFEDINDLLNYCWFCLSKEIKLEDYQEMPPEERLYVLFGRLYDLMEVQKDTLNTIVRLNPLEGKMFISFQQYFKKQIYKAMENCPCTSRYPISYELIAEHYSNTILTVLEWCFLKHKCISKKEAMDCIRYLLGSL
jgi:hypothetical protein